MEPRAETCESVLLVKSEVFVFEIPTRSTNRGYRAADWNLEEPLWTGRMRLVSQGDAVAIKLEDKMTGQLFIKFPIEQYPGIAVEPVTDSSHYFVLRNQDDNGRSALIGLGFPDGSDSFDLNMALQDHFKWLKNRDQIEKEKEMPKQELDLRFKDGETIKINMKITKDFSVPLASQNIPKNILTQGRPRSTQQNHSNDKGTAPSTSKLEFDKNSGVAVKFHRYNRVFMKLDVSQTDHAYMIGKDGTTIKRITKGSQCYVSFPSKKNDKTNNTVAIYGPVENVELIRKCLRAHASLNFIIEVQQKGSTPPNIIQISNKFGVEVQVNPMTKIGTLIVTIKGYEANVTNVFSAIHSITREVSKNSSVRIQLAMDLSEENTNYLIQDDYKDLNFIRKTTNTQIILSESTNQACSIIILGSPINIFQARQQLLGMLPLTITFDLPRKYIKDDVDMSSYALNAAFRKFSCQAKSTTISLTITIFERDVISVYQLRNQLMRFIQGDSVPRGLFIKNKYVMPAYAQPVLSFKKKKLLALEAMQTKPNPNICRVPNSIWSGYGFSKTIPELSSATKNSYKNETITNAKVKSTSYNLDNMSIFQVEKISETFNNLSEMLISVGLEKYIGTFKEQKVDLSTFLTLEEKDLIGFGITAWGAKKKIMTLISEANGETVTKLAAGSREERRPALFKVISAAPPTPVRK